MIFKFQAKLLSYIFVLFLLSGCASLDILTVGLSGISYAVSGKSLSDHLVSSFLDKDCALFRVALGENVCRNGVVDDTYIANRSTISIYKFNKKTINPLEDMSYMLTNVDVSNVELLPLEHEKDMSRQESTYVVIGSFNDIDFALQRKNDFTHLHAEIIRNPIHDVTRYRVVVGPFNYIENESDLNLLPELEKYTPWRLSLCEKSLSLPPCNNHSLVNRSYSVKDST